MKFPALKSLSLRERVLRPSSPRLVQDCLDALSRGESLESILERHPEHATWLREDLQAVGWLQQQRRLVAPPPAFVSQTRSPLISQLQARMSPAARLRRQIRSRLYVLRLATQAGVLLLLGLVLFTVTDHAFLLAERALPGDLVYPLKLAGERFHLAVTLDAAQDARLHMDYTRLRALELQGLLLEGDLENAVEAAHLFQDQFHHTERAFVTVSSRDPLLARRLQQQLSASLQEQQMVLLLLVEGLPRSLRIGVEQIMFSPLY